MSDQARRAYRRFARFFLAIGLVFVALGVLRATLLPEVLRGDPLPVAVLLLAIGGGLRWTVRRRPGDAADPAPDGREAIDASGARAGGLSDGGASDGGAAPARRHDPEH